MSIRQGIDANNYHAPIPFMNTNKGVDLLASYDSEVFDTDAETYVRVVGNVTSKIGWNTPTAILNSDCNFTVPAGAVVPIILPKGYIIRCLSGEVNITPSL